MVNALYAAPPNLLRQQIYCKPILHSAILFTKMHDPQNQTLKAIQPSAFAITVVNPDTGEAEANTHYSGLNE